MMTIKVYEVDRTGITTRTVREKEQVVPLAEPAFTSVMEPCKCLRCTVTTAEDAS
ncbi:hypothetical protein ACWD7Y_17535 [Streptomyces drozdowiczii]